MNVVILGAGAIGIAMASTLVKDNSEAQCVLTYHRHRPDIHHERIVLLQLDATDEAAYLLVKNHIETLLGEVHWIITTIGLLHDQARDIFPEKRIADFDVTAFARVMFANVVPAALAAKTLAYLFSESEPCVFAALSAKVGSIGDNRLGGWYSYRASKAALNMVLKNLAIEFSRKHKNIAVLALHPGTTASPLSEPFQVRVPPHKLFTPERSAGQLLDVIQRATAENNGEFISWDGERLPW